MSSSTIITRGYGAFGSVNKLPTWGYGIGVAVVIDPEDGWKSPGQNRVAVAVSQGRVVKSPKQSRVVWARNQGR